MNKIIRIGVVLMVLALVLIPTTAYALEPPDNILITSTQVVRNTVEVGDIAIGFYFNTDYGTYPSDIPASEAVILRLYDTDNLTLLSTGSPYIIFDYGYGPQVSGFYFDADTVTALGLTWGQPYVLNVTYSEAFLDSPPEKSYILTSADYSTTTDMSENQVLFASWVLAVCTQLEATRPDYTLHGSTDVGVVLTAVGEAYFRGAIQGIQSIAPSLFFLQFATPEVIDISYTANLTSTYGGRLTGTDFMRGLDRIGTHLGITGDFVITLMFFVSAIAMVIFTSYKGWGAEPGMLMGGNWLTMGALLAGNTLIVLRIVLAFIAGIMLLYVLLFRRA